MKAILGHSKGTLCPIFLEKREIYSFVSSSCNSRLFTGGSVVLLYTSKYADVATIVNVCGRSNLQKGVKRRFGEKGLQDLQEKGYLEVKNKDGIWLNSSSSSLFFF